MADTGEATTSTPAEPGSTAPLAPGDPERPTDEAILNQQNEIRAEEAKRSEYVGSIEPMANLKEEYVRGNQNFVAKIDRLEAQYATFRRTRGDGNCFFRGFIYGYLEGLLVTRNSGECSRFVSTVQGWRSKLVEGGYQELVFEDAMELLVQQVETLVAKPDSDLAAERLLSAMRDDTISNMIVMFLRLVTSCEVQRREDFFFPFILGMYDDPPATVEAFCQRHVEPMGEESDHVHIVAITEALQIPVRVVYLDSSGAVMPSSSGSALEASMHDFVPESCPPGSAPRVHLLYRPGHYDVLYPKGG